MLDNRVYGSRISIAPDATLRLAGSSTLRVSNSDPYPLNSGTLALADSAIVSGALEFRVGNTGAAHLVQDGGTFGPGGTTVVLGAQAGSSGSYTFNGGVYAGQGLYVGQGGHGEWTVNSGAFQIDNKLEVIVGRNAGSSGIVRLNGGTAAVGGIRGISGTSTVYFNGGTLAARTGTDKFVTSLTAAHISAGGLILDTGPYAVTVPQGSHARPRPWHNV